MDSLPVIRIVHPPALLPVAEAPKAPPPPPVPPESQQIARSVDGVALPKSNPKHVYLEPFKEHDFSGTGQGRGRQPGWVNDEAGGGSKTCNVCGVTVLTTFTQADRAGMDYHYRDAYGKEIHSMEPLGCPTFIGDTNGAVMDVRGKTRALTGRMDGVETKVESVEDRVARLERDNVDLRAQLNAKIELDVSGLVAWLAEMAALHAQNQLPSVPATINGQPLTLPAPVATMVFEVGKVTTREPVLIEVKGSSQK